MVSKLKNFLELGNLHFSWGSGDGINNSEDKHSNKKKISGKEG